MAITRRRKGLSLTGTQTRSLQTRHFTGAKTPGVKIIQCRSFSLYPVVFRPVHGLSLLARVCEEYSSTALDNRMIMKAVSIFVLGVAFVTKRVLEGVAQSLAVGNTAWTSGSFIFPKHFHNFQKLPFCTPSQSCNPQNLINERVSGVLCHAI